MKNILVSTFALSILALSGCATTDGQDEMMLAEEVEPSTYDYVIENTSQEVLWKRARNHFATVYGDSRSVIRVEDSAEGMIIGKGVVTWNIFNITGLPSPSCISDYAIRFQSKENRARLQLELIEGNSVHSKCTGWVLPSQYGYSTIKNNFDDISMGLENSLKGSGTIDKFSDF